MLTDDFYFTAFPDSTTTYVLIAEDDEGCPSWDTVTAFVEYPFTEFDTVEYCIGGSIELDAGYPGSTYVWNTGATAQTIDVSLFGTYSVSVNTIDFACNVTKTFLVNEVIDNCDPIINIPTAFSPNGDGTNDNLVVIGAAVIDFEIFIFNRWGEVVFYSDNAGILNNPALCWDGTYKGVDQEMGSYVYQLFATGGNGSKIQLQGNITLVR